MFEKDTDQFPIKCPNCHEEFFEKLGRIQAGLDSRCPDCQLRITHQAHQVDRILERGSQERVDYLRKFLRLKVDE